MHNRQLRMRLEQILAGPRYPEKEFVPGVWSYAGVYAMAACLRAGLADAGESAGAVCLCAEDRGVVAAALLAALAGGPALLLPGSLSAGALADLHRHQGYRVAITDRTPRPLPRGVRQIGPDSMSSSRPAQSLAGTAIDLERCWVQLFTGGSTGAARIWPKTVRNLMGEALYQADKHGFEASDRLVATVWGCHIYGLLYSVLAPLSVSASVVAGMPSFPAEIQAAVSASQATILVSVPAHFRALNEYSFKAGALRMAFSSAGMLSAEDGEAFSRTSGVRIVEVYGSTETGGVASRVRADGEAAFTAFDVVDIRIDGELLQVRSDFISPGLTGSGTDFFTMGDRAAQVGALGFRLLGRVDGIVKVGGKRVDLEAVRQVIQKHPRVRDAAVIALPASGGRENQVAAVASGTIRADEITAWLADRLEPCERPRAVRVVDQIPMTAAGKYNRCAIEELFRKAGARKAQPAALDAPEHAPGSAKP